MRLKKNHTEWLEQVNQMRARDIRTIEKAELRELPQDFVDQSLPKEARLQALLEKIENPYCYLDNGMIVKLNFTPRGSRTLADCIGSSFGRAG